MQSSETVHLAGPSFHMLSTLKGIHYTTLNLPSKVLVTIKYRNHNSDVYKRPESKTEISFSLLAPLFVKQSAICLQFGTQLTERITFSL